MCHKKRKKKNILEAKQEWWFQSWTILDKKKVRKNLRNITSNVVLKLSTSSFEKEKKLSNMPNIQKIIKSWQLYGPYLNMHNTRMEPTL